MVLTCSIKKILCAITDRQDMDKQFSRGKPLYLIKQLLRSCFFSLFNSSPLICNTQLCCTHQECKADKRRRASLISLGKKQEIERMDCL